jgi:polysaccharide export outer membrane protein
MVKALSLLLLGSTLAAVPAATQNPTPVPTPAPQADPASTYVVGPGDVLDVTVLDQADASRSTTVQPDGRFTMPLLGDVVVAGKTVAEIQRFITEALSRDFLVNPQVEVRVREYASQFVLVLGEVMNPGRRALRGGTRVIDVLVESGGFRPGASGEILIQRTDGTFSNGAKSVHFKIGSTPANFEKDQPNLELRLKNGDVVTASPKFFVTVDGEVNRPGRVVIENDLTLLGVIAESGGPAKYASEKVRIIRQKADGVDLTGFESCEGAAKDMCRVVDIGDIRKGKVQDVLLVANDKVVVTRRRF